MPHTPTAPLLTSLSPPSPSPPSDSGCGSAHTSLSSTRGSHGSKQAKKTIQHLHISNPAEFLPPSDYQIPKPRDTRRSGSHIPRPANAFLLFRSFLLNYKLHIRQLKNHQQTTSRIAAAIWGSLPDWVRNEWGLKAKAAADLNQVLYPGYKFEPSRKAPAKRSAAKAYAKKQMKSITDESSESEQGSPDPADLSSSSSRRVKARAAGSSLYQSPKQSPCAPAFPNSVASPYSSPSSISSQSRSLPPSPDMTSLHFSFQQLGIQFDALEAENMQLKYRLASFESLFGAGQVVPAHIDQQPLPSSSHAIGNKVSYVILCVS